MSDNLELQQENIQQEFKSKPQVESVDIHESLQIIPKGFAVLEGVIKETSYLNPDKEAKREQFLNDTDKKAERSELLKRLQLWKNALESSENVADVIKQSGESAQKADKLLKKNVGKALKKTKELEAAYTGLDLFFKNSGEKKIKNLTLVNASLKNLTDGDDFYKVIDDEISRLYDKLDLSESYSILCIPGDFKKSNLLERWGRLAHNNKVMLITDSYNADTPAEALDMFESQKFTGMDAYRANVSMIANHLILRDKYAEYNENAQLSVSPAAAYSGRVYATTMSQPVAGTKFGTIYNVGAVKYKMKQSELSDFDKAGLIPMVHEHGRVMPYSAKTLNNGDSAGLQTYSVVRVFDYLQKVFRHFLNQKSFEKNNSALEKEIREQITEFLDSVKGSDKLIEKFTFTRFERDANDPTKIYLDLHVTPYFPAKSFQISIDGHHGKLNSNVKES